MSRWSVLVASVVLVSVPVVSGSAAEPQPTGPPELVLGDVTTDYVTGVTFRLERDRGYVPSDFDYLVARSGLDDPRADPELLVANVGQGFGRFQLPTCELDDPTVASWSMYVVDRGGSTVQDEVVLDLDRAELTEPAGPPALHVLGPRQWGWRDLPGLHDFGIPMLIVVADNVPDFCGTISTTTTAPIPPVADQPTFYGRGTSEDWDTTDQRPIIFFEYLPIGRYDSEVTLTTEDGIPGDGLRAAWQIDITKQPTMLSHSIIRVPTPRYTGLLLLEPWLLLPQLETSLPGSSVAAKIYRGNQVVWYSGVQTVEPDGDIVLRMPALPRGDYRIVAGLAATDLNAADSFTRSFTVR